MDLILMGPERICLGNQGAINNKFSSRHHKNMKRTWFILDSK
jgi:hypothetical protein